MTGWEETASSCTRWRNFFTEKFLHGNRCKALEQSTQGSSSHQFWKHSENVNAWFNSEPSRRGAKLMAGPHLERSSPTLTTSWLYSSNTHPKFRDWSLQKSGLQGHELLLWDWAQSTMTDHQKSTHMFHLSLCWGSSPCCSGFYSLKIKQEKSVFCLPPW